MSSVRKATTSDVLELVRLRSLLFSELADDFGPVPPGPSGSGDDWQYAFAVVLKEQLAGDGMRIVVIDGDTGGLAACGMGAVDHRLPSPYSPDGLVGYIFGIVTDPGHRRRGHARAIMRDLITWFDTLGLARVDLHASEGGRPLYYSLGFTDHPEPTLSRKRFP